MDEQTAKQVKGSVVVSAVASIIMGIIFFCNPLLTGVTLCYFIGAMTLVGGIFKMLFCFRGGPSAGLLLVDGLLCFLLGLLFVSRPDAVATLMVVFMGMYVIMHGIALIGGGMACMKAKVSGGIPVLIMGILLLVLGANLMFAPFTFIMILAGVSLVLDGICMLAMAGSLGANVQQARDQLNNN